MSKYVEKKHGLVIGSDNMFFVIDRADEFDEPALVLPEGVKDFRDGYRAIVSIRRFAFEQTNSINVFVQTPAQQLIWKQQNIQMMRSFSDEEGTVEYPVDFRFSVLTMWATHWLNTNVGQRYIDWDTYTRVRSADQCLFFKKRKDALAFCKEIERMLSGMEFM